MAEVTRVGAASWERAPVRAITLPDGPRFRRGDAPEPVSRGFDDPDQRTGDNARFRRSGPPHSFAAAFLAQAAGQQDRDDEADLALRAHLADRAYRGAAGLSVEILGIDPPLDLRV